MIFTGWGISGMSCMEIVITFRRLRTVGLVGAGILSSAILGTRGIGRRVVTWESPRDSNSSFNIFTFVAMRLTALTIASHVPYQLCASFSHKAFPWPQKA